MSSTAPSQTPFSALLRHVDDLLIEAQELRERIKAALHRERQLGEGIDDDLERVARLSVREAAKALGLLSHDQRRAQWWAHAFTDPQPYC